MIASALLVLAAANVAQAQVSTVSLFPVGFMDDGLVGEAIGTGAGGTTYALSATFDELDIPYTMTLVQDNTHVSITAALETAGVTVPINVQCAIDGSDGVCRQVVGTGIDATTFTESGAVFLTPVPVGPDATAIGAGPTRTSGSVSITFSSSVPTDTDILPPILSSPTRATATLSGADSTATDLDIPGLSSASSSLKAGFMVILGVTIPAVLSAGLLL